MAAVALAALSSTSIADTCDLPAIQDENKAVIGFEYGTQYDTLYEILKECQRELDEWQGLTKSSVNGYGKFNNQTFRIEYGNTIEVRNKTKVFLPAFLKENSSEPIIYLTFNSKNELFEVKVSASGMPSGTANKLIATLTNKYGEPKIVQNSVAFTKPDTQDQITLFYLSHKKYDSMTLLFESHEYKKQLKQSALDAENELKAKLAQAEIEKQEKLKKASSLMDDVF